MIIALKRDVFNKSIVFFGPPLECDARFTFILGFVLGHGSSEKGPNVSCGYGKIQPLSAFHAECIHANKLPTILQQRSARIAGINRRLSSE